MEEEEKERRKDRGKRRRRKEIGKKWGKEGLSCIEVRKIFQEGKERRKYREREEKVERGEKETGRRLGRGREERKRLRKEAELPHVMEQKVVVLVNYCKKGKERRKNTVRKEIGKRGEG
jgi:hypothetical protein